MKALVKTDFGAGNLEIRDVPLPTMGAYEVLVRVKAAAICGSDIERYTGKNVMYRPPVILGHEIAGIVSDTGRNVKNLRIGDRVCVEANVYACGKCWYCHRGEENLCHERVGIGYDVDGGFAEYVKVPSNMVIPLPKKVSFEEGAAADCFVATHAVMDRSKVRLGDFVAIIGPGFLGLVILQLCKLEGAGYVLVAGLKKDFERLQLARKLGADETLISDQDNLEKITLEKTNGKGADIVFDVSGSESGMNQAIRIVRRGGSITAIGTLPEKVEVNLLDAIMKQVTINGVRAYTWTNCMRTLKLLSEGRIAIKPLITHKFPLEEWKKAFQLLLESKGVKILLMP